MSPISLNFTGNDQAAKTHHPNAVRLTTPSGRKWTRLVDVIRNLIRRVIDIVKKIFIIKSIKNSPVDQKPITYMSALPIKKAEKQPEFDRITGIENPGSNCYINSTIQCLFHSTAFTRLMQSPVQKNPSESSKSYQERKKIVGCHLKLQKLYLAKNKRKILSYTNKLRKYMFQTELGKSCGFKGCLRDQNDAERVTRFFLTAYGIHFSEVVQDEATNPLTGKPHVCPPKKEKLITLSVAMQENHPSVQSIIDSTFANEEHVNDLVNTRRIELPNGKEIDAPNWTRKVGLESLPDFLPIHIKRFSYSFSEGRVVKNAKPINLLDGTINLAAAVNSPVPVNYRLAGAVVHGGGINGGHYTSCVRSGNEWFYTSDSMIKPLTNEAEFLQMSKDGYVFFYEKT